VKRDSRCVLIRVEVDGLVRVAGGVVVLVRVCVRVLSGDGVRGVNTRERVVERFVDGVVREGLE
jgi:hypothetical protein